MCHISILSCQAQVLRNPPVHLSPRPRTRSTRVSEAAAPPGRSRTRPRESRPARRGGSGGTERGTGHPFQAGRRRRAGSGFRPSGAFTRSRLHAAAAPRSRACAGIAAVVSVPTSRPYWIKKGEEEAGGPLCRRGGGRSGACVSPWKPRRRAGSRREAGIAAGARTRRRWGRCSRPGGLSPACPAAGGGAVPSGAAAGGGSLPVRGRAAPNGAADACRRDGRCSEGAWACDSLAGAVQFLCFSFKKNWCS